ncbi:MAG: NAD(P)/FAD-dependent oxidoreductase [Herpetosiphonaceae bacterium]|nr:NAD(P)/FAD-dependent oxidoreductase [Herpetosiphonaceae bacterium]
MDSAQGTFDVAIIGSGIGGSTLGAILARQGLRVIVFEGGTHPKFAVGESMILETSEVLRAMAKFYDVPELAYFSSENYFSHIGTSHGVKRHFSFLYHRPGEEQQVAQSLQAVIPKQPHGHELHLYRQDSDYFLTAVAISYGATVLQNTRIRDVQTSPDGVEVITDQGHQYHAQYVVDAGGFRSILAEKFGLRDTNLQAHSRAIFTHMVDVPCFNDVGAPRQEYGIPFPLSQGTLHHVFDGGWLWVIPFNNHPRSTNPLCSVGLQVDPRIHPARPDLSPEEEFYAFIGQYPSMQAQFREAKAVRGWTRTERLQYSSTHLFGERFCLLGHAAGFIDPLFSKGLYTTFMSVALVANALIEAQSAGDYSPQRFEPLDQTTLSFVRSNDRLVANAYKSFSNYKLWSVYSVVWMLGAYLEYVKLTSARVQATSRADYFARIRGLRLVGGGFAQFDQVTNVIDQLIEQTDPADEVAVDRAVAAIKALFASVDWVPHAFQEILKGKNHLPANKLRLGLLKRDTGFMGSGAYQAHFFGRRSNSELVKAFLREKMRYSTPSLAVQRRLQNAGRAQVHH